MTEINKGLKCPFSLAELKEHYSFWPLTYETYHSIKHDISRLSWYNIDQGFLNGTDGEYDCRAYASDIYRFVKYGGPE